MIRQAALYLATPDDRRAALLPIAGRPVAFRTLMGAVRAGVSHIGIPAVFRNTELDRSIALTRSAREAVTWLEPESPAPDEPTLLLPAATFVPSLTVVTPLADDGGSAVIVGSIDGGSAVVAVGPEITRSLWSPLTIGAPLGDAIRRALARQDIGVPEQRSAAALVSGAASIRTPEREAIAQAEAWLVARLGSPIDTWFDRVFHRRLSRLVSLPAARWGVTPNTVTIASFVVGLVAALGFWLGTPLRAVVGLVVYAAAVILDHADGEVARLTFTESAFGEWLDVAADTIVHALIVIAMGLQAQRVAGDHAATLGFVAAAGVLASALLAKIAPPPDTRLGTVYNTLGNRDGFYVMLVAFIVVLATAPSGLAVFMAFVAAGSHAYWIGRVAYHLRRR